MASGATARIASAILARAGRELMRITCSENSPPTSGGSPAPEAAPAECRPSPGASSVRACVAARKNSPLAKRVLPADVIPIIDVERKRHHLVGPESLAEERREPVVCWRTGVAAFRGIQLDQRGRVRPAVGRTRWIGARSESDHGRDRGKNIFRFHVFFRRERVLPTTAHGTRNREDHLRHRRRPS